MKPVPGLSSLARSFYLPVHCSPQFYSDPWMVGDKGEPRTETNTKSKAEGKAAAGKKSHRAHAKKLAPLVKRL